MNPIKHFPVVTVSHKMILPMTDQLLHAANGWLAPRLGAVAANAIVGPTVLLLPGVFGFLVWELKENFRLYAQNRDVNVGAVMFWATLGAAFVALSLALIFHEPFMPQTSHGWLILLGLAIVVQVGGQGLVAYGVGRLPIVASTVLLWMQPLVAAALSWILFGEALGALALLGAVLVLAGIYVVQRSRVSGAAAASSDP